MAGSRGGGDVPLSWDEEEKDDTYEEMFPVVVLLATHSRKVQPFYKRMVTTLSSSVFLFSGLCLPRVFIHGADKDDSG